jgi:replication fork clamp-binding protein CrfC
VSLRGLEVIDKYVERVREVLRERRVTAITKTMPVRMPGESKKQMKRRIKQEYAEKNKEAIQERKQERKARNREERARERAFEEYNSDEEIYFRDYRDTDV